MRNMQRRGGNSGCQKRRGAPDMCVCPQCGYEVAKTRDEPCRSMMCPQCKSPLIGKNKGQD